jgi:hypothetical protein
MPPRRVQQSGAARTPPRRLSTLTATRSMGSGIWLVSASSGLRGLRALDGAFVLAGCVSAFVARRPRLCACSGEGAPEACMPRTVGWGERGWCGCAGTAEAQQMRPRRRYAASHRDAQPRRSAARRRPVQHCAWCSCWHSASLCRALSAAGAPLACASARQAAPQALEAYSP